MKIKKIAAGKAYFINADYLMPIVAEYDAVELWLRRTNGDETPYFAVKAVLMLVGIIFPMTRMGTMADELADIAGRVPREVRDE